MNKVTIVGDIICDKQMLKGAKVKNSIYNFNEMFLPLKNFFKDSDYVIANLETSISNNNYTKSTFSFNNPESLLLAIKKIGINAVSIANNHILDRGISGIESTIKYLEKNKIAYFGISTQQNKYGTLDIDLKDVKLSVLGYTDSTNYHMNKCLIEDNSKYIVNLLKSQKINKKRQTKNIFKKIYYKLSPDIRINIKKLLLKKIKSIIDNDYVCEEKYINHIKESIEISKKQNRFIIMYPHMGGQYNIEPGNYTKKMVKKFSRMGCDSVVITHPHIIQKMKIKNNLICSIGGLVMSPKSKFVLWKTLPEYSLAVHYYFEKNKIKKITISILICVKDKDSYLKIYPFYDFYNNLDSIKKNKYKSQYLEIIDRLSLFKENQNEIKKEYVIKEY